MQTRKPATISRMRSVHGLQHPTLHPLAAGEQTAKHNTCLPLTCITKPEQQAAQVRRPPCWVLQLAQPPEQPCSSWRPTSTPDSCSSLKPRLWKSVVVVLVALAVVGPRGPRGSTVRDAVAVVLELALPPTG
jgi:hypothetical protein